METRDFYRRISAMGKEAIRERKATGEAMHLAPLGWRNARDAEGRSVMEPDPETYPFVMEALAMRDDGHSIRTICRIMHWKGLRSKRGNRIGPGAMLYALSNASDLYIKCSRPKVERYETPD